MRRRCIVIVVPKSALLSIICLLVEHVTPVSSSAPGSPVMMSRITGDPRTALRIRKAAELERSPQQSQSALQRVLAVPVRRQEAR